MNRKQLIEYLEKQEAEESNPNVYAKNADDILYIESVEVDKDGDIIINVCY